MCPGRTWRVPACRWHRRTSADFGYVWDSTNAGCFNSLPVFLDFNRYWAAARAERRSSDYVRRSTHASFQNRRRESLSDGKPKSAGYRVLSGIGFTYEIGGKIIQSIMPRAGTL